jgi:Holliday junction DNA helicase RuvA
MLAGDQGNGVVMFAFLRGVVARKTQDHLELDVNGVGYQVHVPDSVHRKLVVNQETTLLTHCHIREDAFQIFGFLREEEKTLFEMLLGISGIGPKVSLAILSAMSVAQFGKAILDNDVTAFTRVSGVGKKTAQRVVLEMKAKLGQDAELNVILGEPDDKSTAESDDVIAALCSLGCSLAEARKAAATARKQAGADAPIEEIVRLALRSLARV